MPVKNGIDATREIISFDKDACVVMCSILGQERLVSLAREGGARGAIMKPFTSQDVRGVLRKARKMKSGLMPAGAPQKSGSRTKHETGKSSLPGDSRQG